MAKKPESAVEKFIARWQKASGSERANYQLFVHELCTLLELPTPDPARAPVATSNSPICGQVKLPQGERQEWMDCYSDWLAFARRLAASLSR